MQPLGQGGLKLKINHILLGHVELDIDMMVFMMSWKGGKICYQHVYFEDF